MLTLLEAPAEPVVSLEEARAHVRADGNEEDALLERLVLVATGQAESYTRRRFVSQKWRQTFDDFARLRLAYPPLVSVESVKYIAASTGTLTTVATTVYTVRKTTPGEIVEAYGQYWPTPRSELDAVRVEYTCGFGAASAVPPAIKQAILLMVGTLFANRESVAPVAMQEIPQSALWLLGPWRVVRGGA